MSAALASGRHLRPSRITPALIVVAALALPATGAGQTGAAAPESGSPDPDEALRFLPELEALVHPPAATQPPPEDLRWDFSRAGTWLYDADMRMAQEVESAHSLGAMVWEQSGDAAGELLIKAVPSTRTASVVLRNGHFESTYRAAGRSTTQAGELPVQAFVGLKEDGTVEPPRAGRPRTRLENLGVMLFQLPPAGLAAGASFTYPIQIAGEVNRTAVVIHGRATATFSRMVDVAGRTCAQIDGEFLLDRIEAPPDMPGVAEINQSGRSRLLFDVMRRVVVDGAVATRSRLRTANFRAWDRDTPDQFELQMDVQQLFRIRIRE